jgi:hypothetical protein
LARLAKRAKDAIRLDGMRAFIGTVIPNARTLTTKRSSVVTPGSRVLWASSQAVARSNSAPIRSVPVQHTP